MSVSTNDILDTISKMTVLEVVDLIKAMEDKFGVSAAAATVAVAAPGAGGAAAAAEEQTEFNVVLKTFGDNKVGVIKVIRTITGRKQRTELAHTDQATTRGDLRWRETPVYEVVMRLPNGISANKMGNK